MGQTEVAADVLLGVLALLEADHDDAPAGHPGQAGHDGRVVAEETVSVQLDELVGHDLDQLERVGALEVAGLLDVSPDRGSGALGLLLRVALRVDPAEKSINHGAPPQWTRATRRYATGPYVTRRYATRRHVARRCSRRPVRP